jgi:hypothetical protein
MALLGKNINRKEQLKREQMINERHPIVEECIGCNKVEADPDLPEKLENGSVSSYQKCLVYINPAMKWKLGSCSLASHLTVVETGPEKYKPKKYGKKRLGR